MACIRRRRNFRSTKRSTKPAPTSERLFMRTRSRWWRLAFAAKRPTLDCSTKPIRSAAKLGFAPYACPGSEQLGANIAATFSAGCDSVILENHGVVVGGDSLPHAFERFEAFEFAGKTLVKAQQLGKVRFLDDQHLQQAADRGVDFRVLRSTDSNPQRARVASTVVRVRTTRMPAAFADQYRRKFFGSG